MTPGRSALLVVATGAAASVALAWLSGATTKDTAALVALAGGASVAGVAATGVVLRLIALRSLATHALTVALGAVLVTVLGAVVAAWFMFLSAHDLAVLGVVLVLSASVAASGAVILGRRFGASVAAVSAQAEAIGTGAAAQRPEASIVTAELRRLSTVLDEAAADLRSGRAREARLEGSRRELVAWVSHDLRSPIAAVRAMAEALEDGVVAEPADVADYHRAIRQETERLSGLVDDLFELARIQAGVADAATTYVPFRELLDEVVDAARVRADARGVALASEVEEAGDQLVVAADLRRALDNVVDNAIRHTTAGGTVSLRVETGRSGVAVVVADQCGGIPEHDLPRLFDVSFRGDEARSRDTGGGGLGLAIAKGLVEARDGTISVRNGHGGCEFLLRLPGAPEARER